MINEQQQTWRATVYEGKLEKASSRVIGWIRDSNNPTHTIFVDIWVDGRKICTAAANEYRKDLEQKGKGNGQHGFSVLLPTWIDQSKPHVVRVSVLGASPDTPGWALTMPEQRGVDKTTEGSPQDTEFKSNVFFRVPIAPKTNIVPGARALVGKEGWLFLSHDSNNTVGQLQGRSRLTRAQIDRYREVFARRKEKFDALGIPYIFIVAPTKELIYSDYLPENFAIDHHNFPANQIVAALRQDGISVATLYDAMRLARYSHGQVYYRTDTHWNLTGGFCAYQAIVDQISSHVGIRSPHSLEDFILRRIENYRGDLADKPKVIFLPSAQGDLIEAAEGQFPPELYSEHTEVIEGGRRDYVDVDAEAHLRVSKTREAIVHIGVDKTLPKALVFRDSFMIKVMPFLSNHFSRTAYIWKPEPDFAVIERERPDIVLSVMVDRFMRIVPTV